MSINITVILTLLFFFVLQGTLRNHPTTHETSKEVREKPIGEKEVVSKKKSNKLEEIGRYQWGSNSIEIFFYKDNDFGFNIDFILDSWNQQKSLKIEEISSLDQKYEKMLTAIFCRKLIESFNSKKNKYEFNVFFKMKDGRVLKKSTQKNMKCNWRDYSYIDLTKNDSSSISGFPQYRIPPKTIHLDSSELNRQNQFLILELLVNEQGDVQKVGYPSIYLSEDANPLIKKLKQVFVNAKFHPFIENGKAKPFVFNQMVVVDSTKMIVSYDVTEIILDRK
ncbi:hypothetical protein MMO39_02760 [Acinetobacter modestus]|uniref:hypothetical protein n=1 Tax=Acinetobacter modestus TaxID=1776740 RepID=UPI001F4AEC29|nr:hypothetical protein [Acinetobacter modestus]MCH7386227.1 hypothetical protein [Acinetobacter modestus]